VNPGYDGLCRVPVLVAQWAKQLLIGHSTCWADGLKLTSLGQHRGLEGGFQLDWTSGHAM